MDFAKSSPKTPPLKSPRLRKRKAVEQKNKISSWVTKSPKNEKSEIETKLKPLNVSVTPQTSKKESKKKKSKKFQRNSSFEKYGIALPSFEKIVADHKKFDEHKETLRQFDGFDEEILNESLASDCLEKNEQFTGELLDCKHLTNKELGTKFKEFLPNLHNIFNGKTNCERHKMFQKKKTSVLKQDLRCSASVVVFTFAQREVLLELLKKEFDPEDKLTTYFFQVLLPELCLMIFMEVHQMTKRQANAYLDKRPLDL